MAAFIRGYSLWSRIMIINPNARLSEDQFFDKDESIFESYDLVSFFLIKKLEQDLPFAKIDYYVNIRGLRVITISCGDLMLTLELELGYVDFVGIEYDYNLYDLVCLVKAIQHYLMKYAKDAVDAYVYIDNPWGW